MLSFLIKKKVKLRFPGVYFLTIHAKKIYSQICCIVLRVLQTSKEFWVFSVNHLGGHLRKHMFTCDWCIFIHFVCVCVSRFVALDHPVSGNNRSVFFEDFSNLSYSCLVQEKGNAYLLPSTKIPLIIANSFAILEQSRVIRSFVFAGQAGRARCIVICINPTSSLLCWKLTPLVRSLCVPCAFP